MDDNKFSRSGGSAARLGIHERRIVLRRVGNSTAMTVPLEALEMLGWAAGDELAVTTSGVGADGLSKHLIVRRLG